MAKGYPLHPGIVTFMAPDENFRPLDPIELQASPISDTSEVEDGEDILDVIVAREIVVVRDVIKKVSTEPKQNGTGRVLRSTARRISEENGRIETWKGILSVKRSAGGSGEGVQRNRRCTRSGALGRLTISEEAEESALESAEYKGHKALPSKADTAKGRMRQTKSKTADPGDDESMLQLEASQIEYPLPTPESDMDEWIPSKSDFSPDIKNISTTHTRLQPLPCDAVMKSPNMPPFQSTLPWGYSAHTNIPQLSTGTHTHVHTVDADGHLKPPQLLFKELLDTMEARFLAWYDRQSYESKNNMISIAREKYSNKFPPNVDPQILGQIPLLYDWMEMWIRDCYSCDKEGFWRDLEGLRRQECDHAYAGIRQNSLLPLLENSNVVRLVHERFQPLYYWNCWGYPFLVNVL